MGCSSTKVVASDPRQEIEFFDKYELADVLGKGAYGTVHLAYNVDSNEKLAVKILDLNSGKENRSKLRKDARAEERVWARVGLHPNVVALRESFIANRFAYFAMEFCSGSLFKAWEAEPDLNEYIYAGYLKEMAQALAHIHSVGIVHRDVKQDNFIVGGSDGRTVKLCDFGLSAMVGNGNLSGDVGTPPYMAPEMVMETAMHGPPADVWSLGVIVYNAFYGCWPYEPEKYTAQDMTRAIREASVPISFAPAKKGLRNVVSGAGTQFVKALLNRIPSARPSAASCLEMAYLRDGCCNQPHPNGADARRITLVPQFWAAVKCGAFNQKAPNVDECQQWHLMQLQSTAQLRRESCPSGRGDTRRSQAAASDAIVTNPTPSQPGLFDIQDQDLP